MKLPFRVWSAFILLLTANQACTLFHDAKLPIAATPQRPSLSSDTSTTAANSFELEAGATLDPDDYQAIPLALKWGLSSRSEFFLALSPYQNLELPGKDVNGASDLSLGLRHRFWDETPESPSMALQFSSKLATASESQGLGNGETDFFVAGILGKRLGDISTTAYYQLGLLGEVGDSSRDLEHSLALVAATALSSQWSIFVEPAVILQPEADLDSFFVTTGAAYSVSPSLVLDCALVIGLSREAPDLQILFGFTENLGQPLAELGIGGGSLYP